MTVDTVASVSDRQFVIINEQGDSELKIDDEFKSEEICLGGLSGSPVFHAKSPTELFLCGVFKEGGGMETPCFSAHAETIKIDGSVIYDGF